MLSTKFRAARLNFGPSAKPTPHRLAPRALLAGSLALALGACTSSSTSNGTGGSAKGGAAGNGNGGTTSNGGATSSGGSGSGGTTAKGGSSGNGSGGSGSGGSGNGGTAGSGSGSGGSGNGGAAGSGNGGAAGSGNGGAAGSGNGGAAGSGSGGAAGSGNGGSSAGGSSGGNPPGWYMTSDWSVTSVNWQGCVWTGIDSTVSGSTTTITPKDFTSATKEGGPYNVKGTVFNDYNSVAILGFDLNDTPKGDTQQCSNAKRDPKAPGPTAVAFPTGATGIAFNWAQNSSTKVRIQIQEADGATTPTHQWCYNITDTSGKSFAPFSKFNTKCWGTAGSTTNPLGTYYTDDGSPKISSVMFMIAGSTTLSPYDFTINGFAPGTSAADAPGTASTVCGTQTGTVGSTTPSKDNSMMRAKVSGTDCKQYIVQNNNWGNPTGSYQTLSFVGNSFKVTDMNGSGSSAPASFPSIYIGQNGDTANGSYLTTDSNLPIQISAMKSAQSTFKWSGGSGGDYNATYDIWFSKSSTLPASYNDGISGLLMIWLYKPTTGKVPIGSSDKTRSATIGGQAFDVWRGPRALQVAGTDDPNRPVISYVAKSTINNFTGNLKDFFDDAVKNAADDMSTGGTSQAFSNSWYLTDVFGGFEIWSNGKGLSNDGFTVDIQKN